MSHNGYPDRVFSRTLYMTLSVCIRMLCLLSFAVGVKVLGWFPVDKICTSIPLNKGACLHSKCVRDASFYIRLVEPGVSKGAPFGTGCVYIHGVPVFFIKLKLLSGCHLFVRSLQDICQESNALSGICGEIVICLSGLAKFKSQGRCLMRGSGKGGKIPAISWYLLSEMGAQFNGTAGPFIS